MAQIVTFLGKKCHSYQLDRCQEFGVKCLAFQGVFMATTTTISFDLSDVYNDAFSYSLPRKVLEGFAKGLGFAENTTEYTAEEFELLKKDIQDIWDRIMAGNPDKLGSVFVTAGAPGVGKSTLARDHRGAQNFAYICPDDVCLKEMSRTYQAMVEKDRSPEGLRAAYNKWRAASNFAHHLITAHLIREHFNFYFGTTASSDKTGLFLEFLKKHGYTITILHVSAPDQVRFDSIAKRDQVFIQTTDQDALNKQLMVHERIADTFLKYADTILFYLRLQVNEGPTLAAVWSRGKEIDVINPPVFEGLKALHNRVCDGMKKPELRWENTVDKVS